MPELPEVETIRRRLAPALEGSQDAAWTPDGRLLMARGSVISVITPRPGATWAPFVDLAAAKTPGPAVGSITRMAVSRDGRWLAFVAAPQAK